MVKPCITNFSELMVLITSKNRPGYFWAVDEGTEGYLMRDAEQFRVTSPGMNDKVEKKTV